MEAKTSKVSVLEAFRYTFRVIPEVFMIMFVINLINCGLSVAGIYLTRDVFLEIELSMNSHISSPFTIKVLLYALYMFLSSAYSFFYTRYVVQFCILPNFELKFVKLLHRKSARISNDKIETPNAYAFIRQTNAARQTVFRFAEICFSIATAVVQTIVVTLCVASFEIWYLIFLPLALLPPFLEQMYQNNLWKKDYEKTSQLQREAEEYKKAMIDESACKESRLTNAIDVFMKKWNDNRKEYDSIAVRKSRKTWCLRMLLSWFETMGNVGGFALSALLLYFGRIEFSIFTAGVAAYSSLMSSYKQLFSMTGYSIQYYHMIQPFFRYIRFEEYKWTGMICTVDRKVDMVDVSFHYPNQVNPVVENINLTVSKGEVLAIVGENGAGKTTLVNLILGLYRPSKGAVLYDDNNIANIKENIVHKHQAAVMQNFCRYKMSLSENIEIGDFNKQNKVDIEKVVRQLFPNNDVKSDTLLGKEFGGIEISGGQWQRLACHRSFYKDSKFLVLDEANSAIDPLREKELYDMFQSQLTDKIGVIVTHRMGAVLQLATKIIVLSHGKIVESGTHNELIEKGGLYSVFWKKQSDIYE